MSREWKSAAVAPWAALSDKQQRIFYKHHPKDRTEYTKAIWCSATELRVAHLQSSVQNSIGVFKEQRFKILTE